MNFTTDQERALTAMKSGRNVFITGSGGTGKSTILEEYIKYCNDNKKNIIITAPTGVAALNLDGATIHRVFNLSANPIIDKPKSIPMVLKDIDVLVIDEISMCRIDVFDRIAYNIINLNEQRKALNKPDAQIIVSGDFFQLPPVITNTDREVLKKVYNYLGRGFAFSSSMWSYFNFEVISLNDVVRQEDRVLIHNLNKIRHGDFTAINFFNNNVNKTPIDGAIILCGTNKVAKENNDYALDKIRSKSRTYIGVETGKLKESDKLTESELKLKVGARVMTLVNASDNSYKNGSFGTVSGLKDNSIEVILDDGGTVEIFPYRWEIKNYKVKKENGVNRLETEVVATFTQIPVKLAYAITIHKSQGQTYDKVRLNPYCWDHGQLYVALSRVKSLRGLSLEQPIRKNFLVVDPNVIAFYNTIDIYKNIE